MKRFLRILVWIAGILVVLLILAVVALQLFFPVEKVKAMAIEEGSAALGREVAVNDLELSFWGGLGVQLSDVRIGNPPDIDGPEFLSAEAVDLKLRLLPLITGDIRVDRLVIERPTITMHKLADGRSNFAFEFPDSTVPPEVEQMTEDMAPEAKPAAAAISFDELEIVGGTLAYVDDSTGTRIDAINLSLSTALENPRTGFYYSSGRVAIDSLKTVIDEAYPVVSVDLGYRIGYDLGRQLATIERADLELNRIRLKLSGDITDPVGDMMVKANVKSDRVTVADLLNTLPASQKEALAGYEVDGNFELDADIEYNAAPPEPVLYYAGTATLIDVRMRSDDIDGELHLGRCLLDVKPDNLRMTIEDGSFGGRPLLGHLVLENFENPGVSGQLAGGFDLAFVQPFLPAEQKHEMSGRASFDIKFSGLVDQPEQMDFSGTLGVESGRYNSPFMPEPVEELALDAYFDNRLVNLRSLSCRFSSGTLAFNGRVDDLLSYMLADSAAAAKMRPRVESTLEGQVDLALANQYLPEKGDPEMKGQLNLDLTVTGRIGEMASFRPRGTMEIRDAAYTDSLLPEPIEHFAASMRLTPDTIVVSNLEAKFTSSDVTFAGRLADPFPYLLPVENLDRSTMSKPFFDFTLSSHRFDTDRLFPEAVPGSAADPTQVSADSVSMILLPDVDGRGTFSADTIIYSQVEFTNVNGKIKIYDHRIEAYDATASVYSGSVSGRTTIDLSDFENPVYSGEFAATQIEADDFASRFSKFGGHVFGKADFSGDYNAVGWDPDAFLNSLNMTMDATVREGKLVTTGTVNKALNEMAKLWGGSVAEEQAIRNLASKVQVQDGRVKLDQLKSRVGDLGDLLVDGWYGFDGSLNYSGVFKLSREKTAAATSSGGFLAGLASLVSDDDSQRLEVPITVTGTMTKPVPSIDFDALTKKATEKAGNDLLKKAGNALENLFKKD